MKITKAKTFKAEAVFGLKRGYRDEVISIEEFNQKLVAAQQKIFKEFKLKLSAKVSPCSIVFSGQNEPSVELSIIQYPKFQYKESRLKKGILRMVEILMEALNQNRVVVVFNNNTVMIEEDEDQLDPGITFSSEREN